MHEPVWYRYCHYEMQPQAYIDGAHFDSGGLSGKSTWGAYYECPICGAASPCVERCTGNREDALEEAYRLATTEDTEEVYE